MSIALPMPEPLYFDGTRLPASYANFYIANDRILVPTFNGRKIALRSESWRNSFPPEGLWGSTPSIWSGVSARCTV